MSTNGPPPDKHPDCPPADQPAERRQWDEAHKHWHPTDWF